MILSYGEDRQWYRGIVMATNNYTQTANILRIDYGNQQVNLIRILFQIFSEELIKFCIFVCGYRNK